jgi:hypothetical protein
MDRQTKIIIGVLVLGGLSYGAYTQVKKDQDVGKPAAKADLPELKGTDDVDKISIKSEKGEIELEKKGEAWQLVKPVVAPANQTNVKSLLDNMKELKIDELVSKQADDALKKQYELDDAKAVHVVTSKGADKKLDATFGKSGGRGNMVMVPGNPGVFAAKGYSGWMYAREAKDWRDKEIFKFDDANATEVTISNANGDFVFSKDGDKWGGKLKGKAIERLDEEKIKDAIRAMKNLLADDFADGKPDAETGLDAPQGTIVVSLKDGAKYTLKAGKTSTGESRYAKKDGDGTVFVIGSWPAGFVMANVDKFQKSLDGGGAPKHDDHEGMPGMPPGMMMPGMPGMPPGMPPGHP